MGDRDSTQKVDIDMLVKAMEIAKLSKTIVGISDQIPTQQDGTNVNQGDLGLKPDEEVFLKIRIAAEEIYGLCKKVVEMKPAALKHCEATMLPGGASA